MLTKPILQLAKTLLCSAFQDSERILDRIDSTRPGIDFPLLKKGAYSHKRKQ